MAQDKKPDPNGTEHKTSSAPSISLPKGGGAIRGMGEKFAANPVTGTGSMTIPIATSPGRSGFGPQLALSYDSGAGNGPFGLGWHLSLPSITRKTDKGLPKYQDADESDVFILSGAEDLVPVLAQDAGGQWVRQVIPPRTVGGAIYHIQRYRPRIEGLFARIERWTNQADPRDTFWRSISKDNITTWYGRTSESRIVDPSDPTHIFSWLICESHNDKGSVIGYEYKEENSETLDLSQVHERNRTTDTRKANRYLKGIRYGNHTPYFPQLIDTAPWPTLPLDNEWYFEVVFDYGDHDPDAPTPTGQTVPWPRRNDPFSTYRAGFEIRTYRLCQRMLMFHHIPDLASGEQGYDGLVRSTDFTYSYEESPADARNPIFSALLSVSQSGYKRQGGSYLKKSLPPVEFQYTEANVDGTIYDVDPESLDNLPYGLDGGHYQWIDLDGEGLSGILTEQGNGWFYKRNLSPLNLVQHNGDERTRAKFAPIELVASRPNPTIATGQAQFMDLAGDGQPDLVLLDSPTPGFYEHDDGTSWNTFRPFTAQLSRSVTDPNLKFVDLDGDGHTDVLITEDEAFTWHPSLGEEGFGPAERVSKGRDEEQGPALVFADGTQSIYLADLSGDGLTDLVRIRNGEICYWPNLGYGRFGAKVTMDNAPWFDNPDQFDQRRVHLADIDGSGLTDILYLHDDGVRLYFNQSGNGWSQPTRLPASPRLDNQTAVTVMDLLGNGTACLVWSSPLPGDVRRPMRYIDLMGGKKPHLLVKTVNNLGAETRVGYTSSTKFYLQDKLDGKPWITRLPFPVHVVERVETLDRISRNRFVTRYAYHHGYFDGEEREFRGFGMVEQRDTEELAALTESGDFPEAVNIDVASHVPPVLTKTWFHTGVYLSRGHVSDFYAGLLDERDSGEYYREPSLTDPQAKELLLPDTILPPGLSVEEERQACRALKGSMLRQEVYALDGTARQPHPYSVTEQNFTIRQLQPDGTNRFAVFLSHPRESIGYHYERNPSDPRIAHSLTLEVDDFGNVLKSAAVAYGRRQVDLTLELRDRAKQSEIHITYGENDVTNPVETSDEYRTPLPSQSRSYELTGLVLPVGRNRFTFGELSSAGPGAASIDYDQSPTPGVLQKRLIEHARTLYRPNDCGVAQNNPLTLLPLGTLESLALPGEAFKQAFTSGLARQIFVDSGKLSQADLNAVLANEGKYVHSEGDTNWWICSGRVFLSPGTSDTSAQELAYASQHFFLPYRFRDAFHTDAISTESFVNYDPYDLLMSETHDPLDNTTSAVSDYRVLAPRLTTDPNRNRSEVAFDTLGMVVGTAVMGKSTETLGDVLDALFQLDPTQTQLDAFMAAPRGPSANPDESMATQIVYDLLGNATTRIIYDLDRFKRVGEPPFAATIARETHISDLQPGQQTKIQIGFSYSDGFGREIQKKIQAEPGPVPKRDASGRIIVGADGQPEMTPNKVSPRWVGSGWTVFNNKGKPVRQFEPFFTDTRRFEFDVRIGVSPVVFYDPVERTVATLHPNHTWEKVVFDPWQQTTHDVNDTVTFDPKTDDDVKEFFARLPDSDYLPSWNQLRTDPSFSSAFAERYPDATNRANETSAAQKAAAHADTPTSAHFDALGRPFLTVARNRVVCANHPLNGKPDEEVRARVELDIEGNQRKVFDERKLPDADNLPLGALEQRVVMRYAYDMLGNRIHQLSMEAGARWMLNDVAGKPIRTWDSRGHNFTTEYDALRRPVEQTVRGTTAESDSRTLNRDILVDKIEYGEALANAEALNLRTRIYRHSDSAGVATNARLDTAGNPAEAYDFKGNLLRSTRQLVSDYKSIPDWSQPPEPQIEAEFFEACTRYDALNRPIQSIAPHSSLTHPGHPNKFNVIQPVFNEANLLERVDVWLECAAEPGALLDPNTDLASPVGVADIDYDAKGQRTLIDYKTRDATVIRTTYAYDRETFRLTHLYTRRGVDPNTSQGLAFTDDCENPNPPPATIAAPEQPPAGKGCGLQNLHYTYDPAGNIPHIRDDAQQTIYFRNQRVEPSNDYVYDAVYRLIQANGREHLGQVSAAPVPHSHNDAPRASLPHPGDGNAMGTYIERYVYDAVGNFLQMQHRGSDPTHPGWTRRYAYQEASLIEPGKQSNRLSSTQVGNGITSAPEPYLHDAHGNLLRMPHLGDGGAAPNLHWDYKEQLRQADLGGGGAAFYVYDPSGQRVRKVWEKSPGLTEERIYLGGFEVFRKHDGPIGASTTTLERETLQVVDDKQRIALVETRTHGNDGSPSRLVRYQFSNHLGSAVLELDDEAQVISYEECAPYGSTSYQAVRNGLEANPKRYRYTGKERDEETGFESHGVRCYAPWLGRWVSCDPEGTVDGYNLYAFCRLNPMVFVDPEGTNSEKLGRQLEENRAALEAEKANRSKIKKEFDSAESRRSGAQRAIDKAYKELAELSTGNRSARGVEKETERLNKIIEEKTKVHTEATAKAKDAASRLSTSDQKIKALQERARELTTKLGQKANKAAEAQLKKAEADLKPKKEGWFSKLKKVFGGSGGGGVRGGKGGFGKMEIDPELIPEEFRSKEVKDPRDLEFPGWVHAIPRVHWVAKGVEGGLWLMKHRGPYLPTPYDGYLEESKALGRNPVCRLCHDPNVRTRRDQAALSEWDPVILQDLPTSNAPPPLGMLLNMMQSR